MQINEFLALLTAARTRALILTLLALIGTVFPGLIPAALHESIAEHATAALGAALGLWALAAEARHRAERKAQGVSATDGEEA